MEIISGVYKIVNLKTNKIYIGSSVNVYERWTAHKYHLRLGVHRNIYLQRTYNKYGDESLQFSIIESCGREKLTEREQYWIDYYGGLGSANLYNMKEPEGNHIVLSEVSNKISEKLKGRKLDRAQVERSINARKGYRHSEETKRKISESNKGKIISDETRKKISESNKGKRMGIENPFYGKHHTEETKQKLRQYVIDGVTGRKGAKNSNEHNRKISQANKGKKRTPEQIQNLKNKLKGRIPWNKGKRLNKENGQYE